MDQERMMHQLKDIFKWSGELVLKGLYHASYSSYDWGAMQSLIMAKSRAATGHQDWEKFMASPENKELKTFYTNEVNLDQLKTYLKGYGVGFALKEKDDKTLLVFKAKDQAVVTQAFEDLVKDLTTPGQAKALNKRLLKTPKNMSLKEKLAYQTAKVKESIKLREAQAIKAPRKATRQEVGKS